MPFFNLYKPQTYNYKPIYYDPVKEAREKRAAKYAKKENGETEEQVKYEGKLKRGSFREELERNNKTRKEYSRKSNLRFIVILFALLAVAYIAMQQGWISFF